MSENVIVSEEYVDSLSKTTKENRGGDFESVGFVIKNSLEDGDEFIYDSYKTLDGIGFVWTPFIHKAKVYNTRKKASKAIRDHENKKVLIVAEMFESENQYKLLENE